jgi:hypothetical protein
MLAMGEPWVSLDFGAFGELAKKDHHLLPRIFDEWPEIVKLGRTHLRFLCWNTILKREDKIRELELIHRTNKEELRALQAEP